MDERDFFKEGAIALEALSEMTNGDADSVVMNPPCQLPKFFEAQPTANSAEPEIGDRQRDRQISEDCDFLCRNTAPRSARGTLT